MMKFLFWNLNRQALSHRVARLAAAHDVDVLMLAECAIEPADLLANLNTNATRPFCLPFSEGHKLRVFTRFPEAQLVDLYNDPISGVSIRQINPPGREALLLTVVHLTSKINWDRDDQVLGATALVEQINRLEDEQGHRRTILVGDLNMNPFDPGVAGAHALHGVMTRTVAQRVEREVKGNAYRMFYNPMWGHFGDRTPGPSGTYYLRSAKPLNYFWNMYDQVLLRPDLMHALDELRILDADGEASLLTNRGLPRESDGSDHLPILFRLNW